MFSRRVEVTRPVKAAAAAATASPTVVTLLVSQSAEGDEAVVVWDAALVLAHFLERHAEALQLHELCTQRGVHYFHFLQPNQYVPDSKPILEVNPEHPLVVKLDAEADEDRFAELASILFDQANLAEGGQLEDPAGFVQRVNRLMLNAG